MRPAAIPGPNTSLPEILSDVWRRLARRTRFHALPLLTVLAITIGAQMIVLAAGPKIVRQPDTTSYTKVAASLLNNISAPDSIRTPGYPLFLAEVSWLTGSQNLTYAVYAQALLFVLSAVELYALAFIISRRRWISALIAALIGGNLYLANWSRVILSEPLTTWLLISVMLCFAVYLRRPSWSALALLTLTLIASVFTRPQMLYLPALLLAVLIFRALRQNRPRAWMRALLQMWPAIAGMAVVYGLIAFYMFAFMQHYGQFTTTRVGNISLLGVAMRNHALYGMPYDGAGPQYAQLRADLEAFKGPAVYVFLDTHPQYYSLSGQFYGTFGAEVLRAHPGYLALGAFKNFVAIANWSQAPNYPAPILLAPGWLLKLSQYISAIYIGFLPLLVASLVLLWRKPSSLQITMLAALMLVVFTHIFTGAIADFGAFPRLRMPVDWAMLTVTVLAIVQIVEFARAKFASPVPASSWGVVMRQPSPPEPVRTGPAPVEPSLPMQSITTPAIKAHTNAPVRHEQPE